MDPKCSPKGALEASKQPLGAESGFRMLFGVILDPLKSSKMELKFDQKSSADLGVSFGYLEASGGRLGLDFGVILGSILGSRARHAIFAEIPPRHSESTIFRGSGGPKVRPKWNPK